MKKLALPLLLLHVLLVDITPLAGAAEDQKWKSADVHEACKTNMAKIAAQYELSSLSEHRTAQKEKVRQRAVMYAETHVQAALRASRSEIQKYWPGLHDWAVLYFLRASEAEMPASDFWKNATKACDGEFSK